MTENATTILLTAEKAKELREQLKAYRATKKTAAAARKARREERAEEYGRHKEAEAEAQSRIDKLNAEANAVINQIDALKDRAAIVRVEMAQATQARKAICAKLDTAYTDRAAARGAIARLHAEIRGEDGDE